MFLLFDAGQPTSFFSSSFEGTGLLIFMAVGWYPALRQVVNFHKEIILPSSTPSRSVGRLSCEVNYLPPLCRRRTRSLRTCGAASLQGSHDSFRCLLVSSRCSMDSWNQFCLLGRENKTRILPAHTLSSVYSESQGRCVNLWPNTKKYNKPIYLTTAF